MSGKDRKERVARLGALSIPSFRYDSASELYFQRCQRDSQVGERHRKELISSTKVRQLKIRVKDGRIKLVAENRRETRLLWVLFNYLYHPSMDRRISKWSMGYDTAMTHKRGWRRKIAYWADRQALVFKPASEEAYQFLKAHYSELLKMK